MVKRRVFIPDRGDIVWVSFDPQKGREQASQRPAVVLSPRLYNKKSGLAIMCPITSRVKEYPFEVLLNERKIKGAALCDQLRCLDWHARHVKFIQKIKPETVNLIQKKITLLLIK